MSPFFLCLYFALLHLFSPQRELRYWTLQKSCGQLIGLISLSLSPSRMMFVSSKYKR